MQIETPLIILRVNKSLNNDSEQPDCTCLHNTYLTRLHWHHCPMFNTMASRHFQAVLRGKATIQSWSRPYHSATARFTTIDPRGKPLSCDTGIMIGEPDENFVYVEPEVGNAIRSAIVHQLGSSALNHSETLPLQFNHDTKHFAYSKYL